MAVLDPPRPQEIDADDLPEPSVPEPGEIWRELLKAAGLPERKREAEDPCHLLLGNGVALCGEDRTFGMPYSQWLQDGDISVGHCRICGRRRCMRCLTEHRSTLAAREAMHVG